MANPLQVGPLDAEAGSAWVELMNSGLEDCPGFEPLIELDHQRLWGGDRARTGLTLAAAGGGPGAAPRARDAPRHRLDLLLPREPGPGRRTSPASRSDCGPSEARVGEAAMNQQGFR